MIVNLFQNNNIMNSNNKNKEVDIHEIQKYLIDNFIEIIKLENKIALRQEIEKYLYVNYNFDYLNKKDEIVNRLFDKMFGYDILQTYIDDKNVSDIRVVKYNSIYIKIKGVWIKERVSFESENYFYDYVRYCILKNNSNINLDNPIVVVSDKKYNLRIEAGISPVNIFSPSIVIRIHRNTKNNTLESLFASDDMLNYNLYNFLVDCINLEKNIVLCGKSGSGKTTLLRALIDKIPENKAIVTNEETSELFIRDKNIIQREVIINREKSKIISLEKLTRHSLIMSNDIIIIGELKGAEASNFFDSISTGHMGITTVHSDSVYNTIDRIITLIKKDDKSIYYTEAFIERMLARSIDYIIFMRDYKIFNVARVEFNTKEQKINLIELYNTDYSTNKYFTDIYIFKESDKNK